MIEDEEYLDFAEKGYEDYAASTNNKNFRGEEMPKFEDLPDIIKQAWCNVAKGMTARILYNEKT